MCLSCPTQGRGERDPGYTFGTGPGIFEGPEILRMPRVKNFVKDFNWNN